MNKFLSTAIISVFISGSVMASPYAEVSYDFINNLETCTPFVETLKSKNANAQDTIVKNQIKGLSGDKCVYLRQSDEPYARDLTKCLLNPEQRNAVLAAMKSDKNNKGNDIYSYTIDSSEDYAGHSNTTDKLFYKYLDDNSVCIYKDFNYLADNLKTCKPFNKQVTDILFGITQTSIIEGKEGDVCKIKYYIGGVNQGEGYSCKLSNDDILNIEKVVEEEGSVELAFNQYFPESSSCVKDSFNNYLQKVLDCNTHEDVDEISVFGMRVKKATNIYASGENCIMIIDIETPKGREKRTYTFDANLKNKLKTAENPVKMFDEMINDASLYKSEIKEADKDALKGWVAY